MALNTAFFIKNNLFVLSMTKPHTFVGNEAGLSKPISRGVCLKVWSHIHVNIYSMGKDDEGCFSIFAVAIETQGSLKLWTLRFNCHGKYRETTFIILPHAVDINMDMLKCLVKFGYNRQFLIIDNHTTCYEYSCLDAIILPTDLRAYIYAQLSVVITRSSTTRYGIHQCSDGGTI